MEFEVEVCSRCGLAHVRLTGVVTGTGLYRVLRALTEAGTWSLAHHDVWDLRAVQDLFIRPHEATMLAARQPPTDEGKEAGLTAFVTRTISQKAYGIVLFQSIRPMSRLRRSFRSEQSAAHWLADRPRRVLQNDTGAVGSCDADCLLAEVNEAPPFMGMLEG